MSGNCQRFRRQPSYQLIVVHPLLLYGFNLVLTPRADQSVDQPLGGRDNYVRLFVVFLKVGSGQYRQSHPTTLYFLRFSELAKILRVEYLVIAGALGKGRRLFNLLAHRRGCSIFLFDTSYLESIGQFSDCVGGSGYRSSAKKRRRLLGKRAGSDLGWDEQ